MVSPNIYKVTEKVREIHRMAIPFNDKKVMQVDPSKSEEDTLEKARHFMKGIHRLDSLVGFEINYDSSDRVTSFNIVTTRDGEASMRTQFTEAYGDAYVDTTDDHSLDLSTGDYYGATEFKFGNDNWFPLWGLDEDDFEKDPYSHLITALSKAGGSDVSHRLQVLAVPVSDSYGMKRRMSVGGALTGLLNGDGEEAGEQLLNAVGKSVKRFISYTPYDKRGDIMRMHDRDSDKVEREDLADDEKEQFDRLREKADGKRYALVMRLVSHGASKTEVKDEMEDVSKTLSDLFETPGRHTTIKQSLKTTSPNKTESKQIISDATLHYHPAIDEKGGLDALPKTRFRHLRANRSSPMLVSSNVLSMFAHMPNYEAVQDNTISWKRDIEFNEAPPEAEQYSKEDRDEPMEL